MSQILPASAILKPGHTYWLFCDPAEGKEIPSLDANKALIVSLKNPAIPLPGMGYLGAVIVKEETVNGVAVVAVVNLILSQGGPKCGVADAAPFESLLYTVAMGNGALGDVEKLRDEALKLTKDIISGAASAVSWIPYAIVAVAVLGLGFVLLSHVKG